MTAPAATPEQQARLLQARRAALLKRYAAGQRLTRAELEELRGLLPDAIIRSVPVQRAHYAKKLESYESVFGVKVRQIKNWIAAGRDASPPEFPPLDDPPKLLAWWTRHMRNRAPAQILEFASGAAPPAAPPAASTPAATSPVDASAGPLFEAAAMSPATGTPPPLPPAAPGLSGPTVGFSGALQRLRVAEATAGALYTSLLAQAAEAHRTPEQRATLAATAEQQRRAWDELGEKLRRYEKDAESILSASGRMWMADDVMSSATVIHVALVESVRQLIRRLRPRLVDLAPAAQDALWSAEVDRMFAALRANQFTAPAELPDEPAA